MGPLPNDVPWYIPLRPKNIKLVFEYTLYLGVFDSRASAAFIESTFGGEPGQPAAPHQSLCYASLKLNQRGHYLPGSFGLSTFPWALGELQRGRLNRPGWSGAFTEVRKGLEDYLEHHFKKTILNRSGRAERITTAVTLAQLQAFERTIMDACGWKAPANARGSITVDRKERPRPSADAGTEHTTDTVSSVYLQDLERIMDRPVGTTYPPTLRSYLGAGLNQTAGARTDISEHIDDLRKSLSPHHYPDGCWPSPYPLHLLQQFAVNTTLARLGGGRQRGISSVNGPPGAGKTTLLRDLAAAILVRRAKTMVEITDPTRVFKRVGTPGPGKSSAALYTPIAVLRDAGILVASNHDGALNNDSLQLPLKATLAAEYQNKISYFTDVAHSTHDTDHWGLLSVALGDRKRCLELSNRLWYSRETTNLRTSLAEGKPSSLEAWQAARDDFNDVLNKVTAEKDRLAEVRRNCDALVAAAAAEQRLAGAKTEAQDQYDELRRNTETTRKATDNAERAKETATAQLDTVRANQPGFFTYWLRADKRREYETTKGRALAEYNDATGTHRTLAEQRTKLEATFAEATTHLERVSADHRSAENRLRQLRVETDTARAELGPRYADAAFWETIGSTTSQQACPWYSDTLRHLQSELFMAALRVQEVFVRTADARAGCITTTLSAFFAYLRGDIRVGPMEAEAMWSTFFLVVPVVSVSFADIQGLLKDIGPDSLPWLLLDDADRTLPQAAAGAIWRARRAGRGG